MSGRLLAEISRSLPARPVQIAADGARAVLTCGSATFTLLTMPEDEYPALPEMPPAAGTIGSDAFATAVSQSATAAGRDDTLPALTGVRIEIEGDTLTLVSTDRYRLAVRELRWTPARPDLSAAVLVPARALAETARSLTSGAEVSIALALPGEEGAGGDGMIGFEGAGRRTTTRLLGGEFPRYQSLLPTHVNSVAELGQPSCSPRPSSGSPWSPSATPRSGCPSAPASSCSRPAPATRRRPWRSSRPASRATTCRSRSTRSTCSTG